MGQGIADYETAFQEHEMDVMVNAAEKSLAMMDLLMQETRLRLDGQFGEGFAQANPGLVQEYLGGATRLMAAMVAHRGVF